MCSVTVALANYYILYQKSFATGDLLRKCVVLMKLKYVQLPSRTANEGETNLLDFWWWEVGQKPKEHTGCVEWTQPSVQWTSTLPSLHCRLHTKGEQPHWGGSDTQVVWSGLPWPCRSADNNVISGTHSSQGDFLHSAYFSSNHQASTLLTFTGLLHEEHGWGIKRILKCGPWPVGIQVRDQLMFML